MTTMPVLVGSYRQRLRSAASWAWEATARMVGSGRITVGREASLQLHYAATLQHLLPLVSHRPGEQAVMHLEHPLRVDGRPHEVDVLIHGTAIDEQDTRIAVELKCYRSQAASGKKRGATDIFMKDVYEDLRCSKRTAITGWRTSGSRWS